MTQLFAAECDAIESPVIIAAHDHDEAYRVFLVWCEHHRSGIPSADTEIIKLLSSDLASEPQLLEAVRDGVIGVAWWIGHEQGWLISPPDMDVPGLLAPPICPVRCFLFDTEDLGTTYIVEATEERAIALLHLYSLDQCGWDVDQYEFKEIPPRLLTGKMQTLRGEMFRGETGVAAECEDGFWRLFPADYDPPLSRRDGSVRD